MMRLVMMLMTRRSRLWRMCCADGVLVLVLLSVVVGVPLLLDAVGAGAGWWSLVLLVVVVVAFVVSVSSHLPYRLLYLSRAVLACPHSYFVLIEGLIDVGGMLKKADELQRKSQEVIDSSAGVSSEWASLTRRCVLLSECALIHSILPQLAMQELKSCVYGLFFGALRGRAARTIHPSGVRHQAKVPPRVRVAVVASSNCGLEEGRPSGTDRGAQKLLVVCRRDVTCGSGL